MVVFKKKKKSRAYRLQHPSPAVTVISKRLFLVTVFVVVSQKWKAH